MIKESPDKKDIFIARTSQENEECAPGSIGEIISSVRQRVFETIGDILDNYNNIPEEKFSTIQSSTEAQRIHIYIRSLPRGMEPSPYMVFGVSPAATDAQIKKQWRKLMLELHPDKTRGDKAKEELAKVVSWAWSKLDPKNL